MKNKDFCKIDTEYYGEEVDDINQIALRRFNGKELKRYVEFAIKQVNGLDKADNSNEDSGLNIPVVSNCALYENQNLIDNMCISYRHDFGLMQTKERNELRHECKEWLRSYENNKEHCC